MASLFLDINSEFELRRFERALSRASVRATDMIRVHTTLTDRGLQKKVHCRCHRALEALVKHFSDEAGDA